MWLLILGSILLHLSLTAAGADDPATGPDAKGKWPDKVVVTVGDVRTRIEAAKMWTLSGIEYRGDVVAVEESAYGTVITIRGVGHLGTAHFLDVPGKPGAVEKENVTSFQLFVDGERISEYSPTMTLNGESFRMERTSTIRGLSLASTVTIQNGVLVETQRWRATSPLDLQMSYPLMYAWTPDATRYVFGDDDGIQKRGVFLTEGKSDAGLEKDARWMAVFNPKTGKGSVCYLLQRPEGADGWLQWTDGPGVYRKLRIMTFVEKVVPAGFEGVFQSAVGFFEGTEQDWEAKALERVATLKAAGGERRSP